MELFAGRSLARRFSVLRVFDHDAWLVSSPRQQNNEILEPHEMAEVVVCAHLNLPKEVSMV